MYDKLIRIWFKITTVKVLTPFVIIVHWTAATKAFNATVDFFKKYLLHISYENTKDYYECNKLRIKAICSRLSDEKSKKVYINILKYRSTHNRKYLKGIVDREQYFDKDIIHLAENEMFVDCGAYKGDTLKKFLKYSAQYGQSAGAIAFEPDKFNFNCLIEEVNKYGVDMSHKVSCYPYGTWNKRTQLRFQANMQVGSKITEDGESVIEVDSIDHVIGQNKQATFIKMDVEGAEYESLIGAKTTIMQNRPKLAISIYHSDEDMIRIAEYLMREYPFYNFFIRHYTWFDADTVLYAVYQ